LVPSIHFSLPTATMSEQLDRYGAACTVDAQSDSNSSHAGAIRSKCSISLCITSRVYGGLVMIASAAP
jgi:hypothetical protein